MNDLANSFFIAGAGMRVQGARLRVISENLANKDSTAQTPGGDPYRRKTITFKNELDKALGTDLVKVNKIGEDMSDFSLEFDPGHPAANAEGYYKRPNINSLIEMMDMREAQRSYEANLSVIRATKTMVNNTINLLK
ncbi:flagellar basal body rod protein FlgC [Curvivirga sp.]|uniref:flagellar basal body rod protein FlgC n=1 Tax=Curvivirga sp. TaxID=2856848 RepID=UPI003B59A62D